MSHAALWLTKMFGKSCRLVFDSVNLAPSKNSKQLFRKAVTKMFLSKDEDVIFFESVRTLRGFPHMVMECVPVDKDSGALAPIYFKASFTNGPLNNNFFYQSNALCVLLNYY
jgi:Protein similar to CwfJ C-terminus 1